jgi:hypothetical protein
MTSFGSTESDENINFQKLHTYLLSNQKQYVML